MNYEETFKELEKIIIEMESPDIKLEVMMEKYKKALELYNNLEKYLENYKSEIKIITDKGLKDLKEEEIEEENI